MNFETYCISLVKCLDRRTHMLSIKERLGLDFKFFDAVTPEEVSDDLKKKYFTDDFLNQWDINQKAMMACQLSHMKLLESKRNTNLLIIEDDVDIVKPFNWDLINFEEFDILLAGPIGSAHSYFISKNGIDKLLNHFNNSLSSDAYDYELHKLFKLKFKIKTIGTPIFCNNNDLKSNIASKGYILKKKHKLI